MCRLVKWVDNDWSNVVSDFIRMPHAWNAWNCVNHFRRFCICIGIRGFDTQCTWSAMATLKINQWNLSNRSQAIFIKTCMWKCGLQDVSHFCSSVDVYSCWKRVSSSQSCSNALINIHSRMPNRVYWSESQRLDYIISCILIWESKTRLDLDQMLSHRIEI